MKRYTPHMMNPGDGRQWATMFEAELGQWYSASEVDAAAAEGTLTANAQRDTVIEQHEAHIAQMQIEIDAVTRQRDETYAKLVEARERIQQLTFGRNK